MKAYVFVVYTHIEKPRLRREPLRSCKIGMTCQTRGEEQQPPAKLVFGIACLLRALR